MSDIIIPDYLNESVDTIHARMIAIAPDDVSTIEGDMFWDSTRPSAEEKSRLEKIQLQNILRMAFPQTSTGVYLEYIGEWHGVYKTAATKSIGSIQITGTVGTPIVAGTLFGTPSTSEKSSIQFEVSNSLTIDSTGSAEVDVKCTTAGIVGNVEANTIILLIGNISGIKSVTNTSKFTGGTDIEEEEHYRARVIAVEQEDNLSGADSDYVTWALEVDGTGSAYVIEEWEGPGTVKVLILDKNGQPATTELIKAVKDYIYPDKLPGKNRGGKAPLGAVVTIDTAHTLAIYVKANFTFTSGFSPDSVLNAMEDDLSSYLAKITISGTVNYNVIHSIVGAYIESKKGIDDFENLTINDGTTNINLVDQVPVIGEVVNIT